MRYCVPSKERSSPAGDSSEAKIFYRRFGSGGTKVLLIIGLAGTHEAWRPQIKGLTGACDPNEDDEEAGSSAADEGWTAADGIEVCCFDNRGMGRSSIPAHRTEYSTMIMARDAWLCLMIWGGRKLMFLGTRWVLSFF